MKKAKEDSHSFSFEVPYRLLETGDGGPKPLIIYLHGYKQNGVYLEKKARSLCSLEAWHLFLNGPYPIYDESRKRKVERWGRAWYLYDGRQPQFMDSLEKSSIFIDDVIHKIDSKINANRYTIVGYSMGGYLAGYYGLSRPQHVDDMVIIGGRIKTEHFKEESYKNLRVLELHGNKDESVAVERVKASCEQLEALGAQTAFNILKEGHRLNSHYIEVAKSWLLDNGYDETEHT